MASPTLNAGREEELTLDDVKLDDLTLDDDALFADLDNEVRLEGAGENSVSLDSKDDALNLDFDVEAVGAPTEAASAKPAPAGAVPPKGGSAKDGASGKKQAIESSTLGSLDEFDLDIPDAGSATGDAAEVGGLDLDLDMTRATDSSSGGDLDLDLTDAAGPEKSGGDILDLNLDLEEPQTGEQGMGTGGADSMDLSAAAGKAGFAVRQDRGATTMEPIEVDLGTEEIGLGEDAAGGGIGEPAAGAGGAEIDLGLDAEVPFERSRPKGAEQLEAVALAGDRSEGGPLEGKEKEAVLDTEELPAAGAEEAPRAFEAVPDVDLNAIDLNLDMPPAESHGDELTGMAPPDAAERGGTRSEDVVELNLADLESQPAGLEERPAAGAAAGRRAPVGEAAGGALAGSVLLSIPHQVQVRMGSVSLHGQEILNLNYGSVVPLNRSVGEPVELTLNGKTIAQGEIVVINGRNLGVRIVALGG